MPGRNRRSNNEVPEFAMPEFRSYEEEAAWFDKHGIRLADEAVAILRAGRKLGNRRQHHISLRPDVQLHLQGVAERRGMTLDEVVNDLLVKDLAIAEAVRPAAQKSTRARRR
ncbi:MAG TPA: hypothetical protein VKV17_11785 [Bryobacteraceae bacterium]|nr:hypothetical protein [Bryobacteraceae bacterium]